MEAPTGLATVAMGGAAEEHGADDLVAGIGWVGGLGLGGRGEASDGV